VAAFVAGSAEFIGRFSIQAPIESVFQLFSPLGERAWVPGWNPELLHPSNVSWALGQIFRTREEQGDAVWIVTDLDNQAHRVEYHRVEPNRYVARVRVQCSASSERRTEISTAYAFVGLSNKGNDEIAAMTDRAYDEKMKHWERWIAAHFSRAAQAQSS
jgi:hypothetical protein